MTLLTVYRNKILLWLSLACLTMLGGIFGIIVPTIQALGTTKAQIETVEQRVQNDELDLQKTIANQKHAAEIAQALTTLQTTYITTNNPIDFISRLEQLGEQHQVALDFNLDTAVANTSAVPITLHLTGTLPNCLAFMNDALRDVVYINITDLTIASAATEASSADQVNMTIQALTYWR